MATKKVRVSVVQTLAVLGDIDANIAIVERYTEEAVRQGAKLIVFPECMNSGYLFDSAEHCRAIAEPIDGKFPNAVAALCRRHKVFIATGFTEKGAQGKAYNSGLLFDPDGKLICHYQKQFLATHDQNWFEVGIKGNPVVDTEIGRIGLLICFDGRIPEIARCLAAQGAQIVLDMANFFAMDQAEMWVPARAYENGVWFVAATKSGVERSIYYPGGSMIVSPTGEVKAKIPYDSHGVVSADIVIDTAEAQAWSFGGSKLNDREPSAYRMLTKDFPSTPLSALLAESIVPEAMTAKVAAIQAHVDAHHTLEEAIEMVEHAARLGVKVIALPSHFASPLWALNDREARQLAAQTPSLIDRFQALCSRYDAIVMLPSVVQTNSGLRPAGILIGAAGVIGQQQQVHLGPHEAWSAETEKTFQVFETKFGRIGMVINYDGMFPESTRTLALLGAEILIWSCAWEHANQRDLLAVPKAEDNRVYVVCANRADSPYPGGSFVISPSGFPHWDVNVSAPRTTRWGAVMPAHANLALARQKKMIPGVDMVRNRLTQTYAPLTA